MLVFVYGTLLKGCSNHHILEDAEFRTEAETEPEYTMISLGGFPGVLSGGKTAIKGEVYFVFRDGPILKRLDALEGHPRWYVRTPIILTNGMRVEMYVYPESGRGKPEIKSGSWREYRG